MIIMLTVTAIAPQQKPVSAAAETSGFPSSTYTDRPQPPRRPPRLQLRLTLGILALARDNVSTQLDLAKKKL